LTELSWWLSSSLLAENFTRSEFISTKLSPHVHDNLL
jgi:hypothetical protein